MKELSPVTGLNYRSSAITELLSTLKDFEKQVSAYVNDQSDVALGAHLAREIQTAGITLQMLELRGAELLTKELESLLVALVENNISSVENGLDVLVKATAKLFEYLEHSINGSADIPLALLPTLNDLRAVQNLRLLSEAVILLPDFTVQHSDFHDEVKTKKFAKKFRYEVKHARAPIMRVLLKWYKSQDTEFSLNELYSIFEGLYDVSKGTDLSRLWRVTVAVIESLTDQTLETTVAIKTLFAQIERFLQELMALGDKAVFEPAPLDLLKNLLYYIALSSSTTKRVQQIKSGYQLQDYLPDSQSRDRAIHALDGPSLEMLQSVGQAIRDEFTQIKVIIEIFAHADDVDESDISQLPERLDVLSHTLEMLGMNHIIDDNTQIISDLSDFLAQENRKNSQLIEIAAAVLRLDLAVDDYIHSQEHIDPYSLRTLESHKKKILSSRQYDNVSASLLTESLKSLAKIKGLYLKVCDDENAIESLENINALLCESAQALQILPMPELALLFNGLAAYCKGLDETQASNLSAKSHRHFADVVSSLEVYIDLQIHKQSTTADLLGQIADSLEELLIIIDQPLEDIHDETFSETQVEATVAMDTVEPSMVEVFIDEAMLQFKQVSASLSELKKDNDNHEALQTLRRSYHTLKGSGRMVGAMSIADFSWSMENLLNHILDGALKLDKGITDFLYEALAALAQLIDQLHGDTPNVEGIDSLIERAFEIVNSTSETIAIENNVAPTLAEIEAFDAQETDEFDLTKTLDLSDDIDAASTLKLPSMEQADTIETNSVTDDQTIPLVSAVDPTVSGTSLIQPDEHEATINEYSTTDFTDEDDAVSTLKLSSMDQTDTIGITPVDDEQTIALVSAVDPTVSGTSLITSNEQEEDILEQSATVQFGMDPTLLDIFTTESRSHIATLQDLITISLESGGQLPVSENVARAFHTLLGSAQTARAESIAGFLQPIESAVKKKLRVGGAFSRGQTLFLQEILTALELKLEALIASEPESPEVAEIQARVGGFVDRIESEDGKAVQLPELGELQSVFVEESQDIVEHLQTLVPKLVNNANDLNVSREMQSSLHTLKGSARVASYSGIADLAHAMEDALQRWADSPEAMDEDAQGAITDAVEALSVNIEQAQTGGEVGYFDWLIEELSTPAHQLEVQPEETQELSITPEEESVEAPEVDFINDSTLQQTLVIERVGATPDRIRLDASLLDDLTDLNNDAGVHQSNTVVAHDRMSGSMSELDQTVKRLRSQLRELDFESDLLIPSQQKSSDQDFDPLELDSYSKVQTLSKAILESFSDLDEIRYSLSLNLRTAQKELSEQWRVNSAISEMLTQIRMVKFETIEGRLRATFERTSASLGKKARLSIQGTGYSVDQSLLKPMTIALEHLIRNAIAHGVSAERVGEVSLSFAIEDGDVFIEIEDNGEGVDTDAIRAKAIEQNLINEQSVLSQQLLLNLISRSGFSTEEDIDQVSGRGVGLDTVQRELRKVGGSLSMQTEKGVGTRFSIKIPQSQFLNQVVLVKIYDMSLALPANIVHGVSRIHPHELERFSTQPDLLIEYQEHSYKFAKLSELMKLETPEVVATASIVYLVLSGVRIALVVDSVGGNLEAIIKPIGRQLASMEGYSGAFVQADGEVVPILNMNYWLEPIQNADISFSKIPKQIIRPQKPLKVLVVDDSITMRKYAQRTLLGAHYLSELAHDGVAAVQYLQNNDTPDCIITDLEMPRMDGFELINVIRNDLGLTDVPILVITSRTGTKHQQRLQELGIDGLLGKPYQEGELLSLLELVFDNG